MEKKLFPEDTKLHLRFIHIIVVYSPMLDYLLGMKNYNSIILNQEINFWVVSESFKNFSNKHPSINIFLKYLTRIFG